MFPYRDMRSVCPYGDTGQGYPATRTLRPAPEEAHQLRRATRGHGLPTYRSRVSRTTSGSGARRLSLWTAEVSRPEPVASTQVRACLSDRSSDCSHALSHATRMALSDASIDGATMAASTATRQRGGGFAERLAALRQDTLVEIELRGPPCPPDRPRLSELRSNDHRLSSELTVRNPEQTGLWLRRGD